MCWFHTKKIIASKRTNMVRVYDLWGSPIGDPEDVVVIIERCDDCHKEWAKLVPIVGRPIKINVEYAWSLLGYDPAHTPS